MIATDPDPLDQNLARLREILTSRFSPSVASEPNDPLQAETSNAEADVHASPPSVPSPGPAEATKTIETAQIRDSDSSPLAPDPKQSKPSLLDQPSAITNIEAAQAEIVPKIVEDTMAPSEIRSGLPARPSRMNWFRRILRRLGL